MDEHFSESPDLKTIAEAVNITPGYFQFAFEKTTGQTPHNYLMVRKLNMAKKLLATTTLPLSDIAFQSGFSSQSYFGYVFKKEVGMTPFAYRKSAQEHYPA